MPDDTPVGAACVATAMHASAAPGPAAIPLRITDLAPGEQLDLVHMWRASFEFALDIVDPNPIEAQLAYLREQLAPVNRLRVAWRDGVMVGFLASNDESVTQLFVRVGHIGQGIGRQLLELAKAESAGGLWLYTFQRNLRARRFYERNGFAVVAYGFEPTWQLPDVKYIWTRDPGVA